MMNTTARHLMKLAGFVLVANANAALIDHGNYLTDTQSGNDWLDVTESVNLSHDQVVAEMAPGGRFFGWRYASGTEFINLISNATKQPLSSLSSYYTLPNLTDDLVTMLGSTLDSYYLSLYSKTYDEYYSPYIYSQHYTLGLLSDEMPDQTGTAYFAAWINDMDKSGESFNDSVQAHAIGFGPEVKGYNLGSYLVRASSAVPEPASAALMASSFMALMVALRKKAASRISDL